MTLVFKKIMIKNFLSIGDAEVDLHEQGFVLVNGRNEESSETISNGSGKSAIFDSILWTITGETTRGASNVVNEARESDGVICTLYFDMDESSYQITRSKGTRDLGNKLLFYKDEELLSDQIKKSQDLIYKVIPVADPQILSSIVLLGQGLPNRFTSLSPSKRKELLETLSGSSAVVENLKSLLSEEEALSKSSLDKMNTAKAIVSGELSSLESSLKSSEDAAETYKQSLEHLQSEKLKDKPSIADKETLLSTIRATSSEKEVKEKQIDTIQESLVALSEQEKDLLGKKSTIESTRLRTSALMKTIETDLSVKKREVSALLSGVCPTCKQQIVLTEDQKKAVALLEEEIKEKEPLLSSLEKKSEDLLQLLSTLQDKSRSLLTQKEAAMEELSSLRMSLQEISSKLSDLEKKRLDAEGSFDYDKEVSVQEALLEKEKESIKRLSEEIMVRRVQTTSVSDKILKEEVYHDGVSFLQREVSRDFKGFLLKDVIDFLSMRTKEYSRYLFLDGKTVSLSLKGTKIEVLLGKRPYENLSGGERQRADLAVQFALRDMLVTTVGFSCNILTLDEVFDNLDEQGCSSLIQLLVSELTDIESIYVVTHHSEIDIPYDKNLLVVKDSGGVSSISFC